MRAPRLYLIGSHETTGGRLVEACARVAEAVIAHGVAPETVALQVREKALGARELLALVRAVRAATAPAGLRLFVNDRLDVALAAGADGVHLGERLLRPEEASALAPHLPLALSTHSPEELAAARQRRAPRAAPEAARAKRAGTEGSEEDRTEDRGEASAAAPSLAFAVFGPVFDTPAKRAFGPPQGLARLREAVASAGELPVLALGGLTDEPERLAAVAATGAHGLACMRLVLGADDPGAALIRLLTRMPARLLR